MKKPISTILFASVVLAGFAMQNLARAEQECDPGKPETTPASRLEINRTDGTAFDTKTKLIWKICAEGQSYSDGRCTGNATDFTWDNAIQTFGDKGDNWRLPNVDELNSLVEGRCRNPAINRAIFPDAPKSPFWSGSSSGSSYVPNPARAWLVFFSDGVSLASSKAGNYYVRLVRGGQWINPSGPLEKQRLEDELIIAVAQAEKNSYVPCKNKAICDKTFSLTQIYINSKSSQKIQVATDTIIETYNPTENGNIGMSAIKIPGKGSSAAIRLTVTCKVDDGEIYDKLCGLKKLEIYNGFRPFVNKMLGD